MLDRQQGLEIAIEVESVNEATPVGDSIRPLPASVSYVEGIMRLRSDIIPVINMKKRLGLGATQYENDAKVAVVTLARQQYGLLFDDIRDVLRVDSTLVMPIGSVLQSEDPVISDLIKLEDGCRTLELLDLQHIFNQEILASVDDVVKEQESTGRPVTYSRYVVFSSCGQDFGVPVDEAREITFIGAIDDIFKSGCVAGALQLRGRTIPVLHSGALLNGQDRDEELYAETERILILQSGALSFGMIVDEVREILTLADEDVMAMPHREKQGVTGIYEAENNRNIMLLEVATLIKAHREKLKSMARIEKGKEAEETPVLASSRHLITENCYLVFSIEKNFAIRLKDVQEIIERDAVMRIPAASGFDSEIINLRGNVVPVVNMRHFYGYSEKRKNREESRLIICKSKARVVALEVDDIVTIYKQEQFHPTPSLNPQLQPKKDTLDRLIEFIGEDGVKEHVLVVNMENMTKNHLSYADSDASSADASENKEINIH